MGDEVNMVPKASCCSRWYARLPRVDGGDVGVIVRPRKGVCVCGRAEISRFCSKYVGGRGGRAVCNRCGCRCVCCCCCWVRGCSLDLQVVHLVGEVVGQERQERVGGSPPMCDRCMRACVCVCVYALCACACACVSDRTG